MAHRSLARTSLAASLTATLLLAPAAGQALALGGGDLTDGSDSSADAVGEQTVEETDEAVEDTVDAVSGGEAAATAEEPAAPVDDTVEATTDAVGEAADGVREVVEKAASGDPGGATESTANTVEDTTNTVSGVVRDVVAGGVEAEGDDPAEVSSPDDPSEGPATDPEPQGPHRTNSTSRLEPDGGFDDRSASISSGFTRNVGGGNGSASRFEPPATGGVFDPARGGSSSAPSPDVDSLAEPTGPSNAGVPNPRDIPTSLVLTATALLVLVGAGHVLHAVRRGGLEFG